MSLRLKETNEKVESLRENMSQLRSDKIKLELEKFRWEERQEAAGQTALDMEKEPTTKAESPTNFCRCMI